MKRDQVLIPILLICLVASVVANAMLVTSFRSLGGGAEDLAEVTSKTESLESAISQLRSDINELRETTSSDLAEDASKTESLKSAISQLRSDINELSKNMTSESPTDERPLVVLRIDDIQDVGLRHVQIPLLEYNLAVGLPMSLSVMPDHFGDDKEMVEIVSFAANQGAEITAHGMEYLTEYDLDEQTRMLQRWKEDLKQLLGVEVTVLTPPDYAFNDDTLLAMKKTGYSTITSNLKEGEPRVVSVDIVSIPSTVEFSSFIEGKWQSKDPEALAIEVSQSVRKYGYAIIVTHPQEFLKGDEFDVDRFEEYKAFIRQIRELYSFTVIEKLRDSVALHG